MNIHSGLNVADNLLFLVNIIQILFAYMATQFLVKYFFKVSGTM